ncbi:hypothetical protein CERSUDRAFT_99537 [Gelatoporia subvermispora B]|uniref:DUF6534 domain-containing protein n=1 Tax=Ceriporiopsis subvermispora (strain B) TaxID=914234 RepID=M2R2L0_CERS8|nr:hypothetical protein CERSUDRAFT_99537 [Gelatoporia subvermispora B]
MGLGVLDIPVQVSETDGSARKSLSPRRRAFAPSILAFMPSIDQLLDLNGTLGAGIICAMVTSALYGVTTIQSYLYFHRPENDSKLFKSVIAFLWVLDTVHQIFICHLVYTYAVVDYDNLVALTTEAWDLYATVYVTAVMDLCVRSIFCLRIWKVSNKNLLVVVVVMICSLAEFGGQIAFVVRDEFFVHGKLSGQRQLSPEYYFGAVCCFVSDSLIALSQVAFLWNRQSQIPRTNYIIRTLIMYSINTGLVTALCALGMLVTWATMPNNLVYIPFIASLPTLLFNALLATLNARHELRETMHGNGGLISIPLSGSTQTASSVTMDIRGDMGSSVGHGPRSYAQHLPRLPIRIEKEVKIDRSEMIV